MGKDMVVSIVWIPMLPGDSESAAQVATALIPDARAQHFFDADCRAVRALASRLGGEDRIAWDMYLFFSPGVTWGDEPPLPMDWVHQLDDEDWADPARYRCGNDLVAALVASADLNIRRDRARTLALYEHTGLSSED